MWFRIEVGGIRNWRVGSGAAPEPLDSSPDLLITRFRVLVALYKLWVVSSVRIRAIDRSFSTNSSRSSAHDMVYVYSPERRRLKWICISGRNDIFSPSVKSSNDVLFGKGRITLGCLLSSAFSSNHNSVRALASAIRFSSQSSRRTMSLEGHPKKQALVTNRTSPSWYHLDMPGLQSKIRSWAKTGAISGDNG